MIDRQVRDFVQTALGVQSGTGVSMEQAKLHTDLMLGVPMPSEAEINRALIEPPAKNNRGRVRSEGLSKRDAVAELAAAGICLLLHYQRARCRPTLSPDQLTHPCKPAARDCERGRALPSRLTKVARAKRARPRPGESAWCGASHWSDEEGDLHPDSERIETERVRVDNCYVLATGAYPGR